MRSSGTYVVDYEYGHWTGRPTAMHDRHNNRTLGFRYNDQGQLDSLIVRGRTTWTSVRNADLQTTTRIYPAAFEQTFEYSGVHRRAEIDYSGIVTRNYGFDAADRIESVDDGDLHTYAYDGLGQLLEHETYDMSGSCTYSPYYPYMDCSGVDTTLVATESFSYDPVGNRTDGNAQIGPGSRLTSIDLAEGTLTYSYDAAGNVTQRELIGQGLVQDLYWNALGRPDSIVTGDGSGTTTSIYRYDAFGRRIRVEESGSTTESVWAMGHVLFDIEGTTVTEYAYLAGTDRLHSMYRTGEFHYYLTDYLGSVVAVVDSTGAVRNSYDYDVWGDETSSSEQLENRFGFAGREYDSETGLYYNRARYYDAKSGRFLSEDPLGHKAGPNPYRYAANNPLSFSDPLGLYECEETEEGYDCEVAGDVYVCYGPSENACLGHIADMLGYEDMLQNWRNDNRPPGVGHDVVEPPSRLQYLDLLELRFEGASGSIAYLELHRLLQSGRINIWDIPGLQARHWKGELYIKTELFEAEGIFPSRMAHELGHVRYYRVTGRYLDYDYGRYGGECRADNYGRAFYGPDYEDQYPQYRGFC